MTPPLYKKTIPNAMKITRMAKILNHTKIGAIHLIKNIKINAITIAKPKPAKM